MKKFSEINEGMLTSFANRAVDKETGEHHYFRWKDDGTLPLKDNNFHDGPNGHKYMTASNGTAEFKDGRVLNRQQFDKKYHHRLN